MTELFKTYLELAIGAADAPAEKKQIITSRIPKNLTAWNGPEIVSVRELLLSSKIESTTLLQTELANTVLEGAQPAKCMREIVPVVKASSGTYRWPLGEAGIYAKKLSEGGEVPARTQNYDYRDFTIYRFGQRPLITQEMIDRSQYDVINMEVKWAGEAIENRLNQESLSVILQNSGNEVDTTHSGTAMDEKAAVAKAIAANSTDKFMSDVLVMTPGFAGEIMATFVTLSTTVAGDIVLTGRMPSILGLKPYICNVSDNSTSYVWENDTDGDIGAMVVDSQRCGGIAMEKDIWIDQYKDPVRDLVGCVAKARFGTNYLRADAACRIVQ